MSESGVTPPDAREPVFGPGMTVGHYRIKSKIGSGGMGEVYEAFDTQLERPVALKILRPALVHDAEKVRRFAQEARAASALNHPAIVTIYEVASVDGPQGDVQYIAMELIAGMSLREYFRQNLALAKLLDIVAQVAEGMAKAHSSGVIHRDLKPDNIVVTPDGKPKIVDFGLAKLYQPDALGAPYNADDPTLSYPESAGAVVGTVGYISPEQIEGRPVDHRSDVFSLGCVLYEAVARRRAFDGDSTVEVLHAILRTEPAPVGAVNASAPPQLDRVVRRCLAKDPEERYQSIKEVAIEIRQLLADDIPRMSQERRTRRRSLATTIALAAAVGVAAFSAALVFIERRSPNAPEYRYTPFSTDAAYEGFPAWSPDGRSIAYIEEVGGILQVFIKGIDAAQPTQITHAVRDCREPFWDPRGNRIFYIALAGDRDSLWSVGVGGGEPEVFRENVSTAAISPDRKVLAMLREAGEPGTFALTLWTSSPPEADPKPYPLAAARHFANGFIRFSPDNNKIALWTSNRGNPENRDAREFWIIPRNGSKPYSLLPALQPAPRHYPFAWMPDSRHVVFSAEYLGANPGMHLWRADTATGKLVPLTKTAGIEYYPSVSPDGKRIVYSSEEDDFDLIRVPLDGSPVAPFLATARTERDPVWSPARNEYVYITNRTGAPEIWLASGDGQWHRPVTTGGSFDGPTYLLANIAFSPDGQRIAFQRRGTGGYRLWISSVAGGPAVALTDQVRQFEDTPSWSPDGNWLAYVLTTMPGASFTLVRIRVGTDAKPEPIKTNILFPSNPQWSPRGDWITVDTPEGFAIVTPDGSRTRLLSEHSWSVHTWARDGSTIYGIRTDDNLHLVLAKIDVTTAKETVMRDLGASSPMINPVDGLSLAPDGKSFLTSLPHLRGDLWIVDRLDPPKGNAWERFRSSLRID